MSTAPSNGEGPGVLWTPPADVGETTEILNNEGYSYMLRGDLRRARAKLSLAHARDPNNPVIANNLKLLDGSARYVKRDE